MPAADQSRSFLLTTWEGGGSVAPALTVARKLVARGHQVRVMSDECNRRDAEAACATCSR
jgi:UDP-N-acetylglucosamine:LPS N-acetylglucosamine transferase